MIMDEDRSVCAVCSGKYNLYIIHLNVKCMRKFELNLEYNKDDNNITTCRSDMEDIIY